MLKYRVSVWTSTGVKLQRSGQTSRQCRVQFDCTSVSRSKVRRKWRPITCSTPVCTRTSFTTCASGQVDRSSCPRPRGSVPRWFYVHADCRRSPVKECSWYHSSISPEVIYSRCVAALASRGHEPSPIRSRMSFLMTRMRKRWRNGYLNDCCAYLLDKTKTSSSTRWSELMPVDLILSELSGCAVTRFAMAATNQNTVGDDVESCDDRCGMSKTGRHPVAFWLAEATGNWVAARRLKFVYNEVRWAGVRWDVVLWTLLNNGSRCRISLYTDTTLC